MNISLRQCCECATGLLRPAWKTFREDGEKKYLCKSHAMTRTAKKQIAEKKKEGSKLDKDNKFFEYVWKIRPHFCQECGKELGEMKKWYMHHILSKAKYPYFRYDERNILMLCYQHHNEIESATSAPKLRVFEIAERTKRGLLDEVGMTYEIKSVTYLPKTKPNNYVNE